MIKLDPKIMADPLVAALGNRYLGAYVRLLLSCDDQGRIERRALPYLAREEDWPAAEPWLAPLFVKDEGHWTSPLVAAQRSVSRARAQAGAKGGAAKKAPAAAAPAAPLPVAPPQSKVPPCQYQAIAQLWNEIMVASPQVELINESRRRRLHAIWVSDPRFQDLAFWRAFFGWCSTVPWMRGEVIDKSGNAIPPARLDTILRPSNFPRYTEEAIQTWRTKNKRLQQEVAT